MVSIYKQTQSKPVLIQPPYTPTPSCFLPPNSLKTSRYPSQKAM